MIGLSPNGEPFAATTPSMHISRIVIVALAWVASIVLVSAQQIHPSLIRNHPAIAYATAPLADPVAQLNSRLQRGEVSLEKNGFRLDGSVMGRCLNS